MVFSSNEGRGPNRSGARDESKSIQPADPVVLELMLQVRVLRLPDGTLRLIVDTKS